MPSQGFHRRKAKKGVGDEIPRQVIGTGACRRLWRKQAGGASGIARSAYGAIMRVPGVGSPIVILIDKKRSLRAGRLAACD